MSGPTRDQVLDALRGSLAATDASDREFAAAADAVMALLAEAQPKVLAAGVTDAVEAGLFPTLDADNPHLLGTCPCSCHPTPAVDVLTTEGPQTDG